MSRCPAPVRTRGGVLSCVSTREGCTEPSHRRWDRVAPLMALLWRIKPWWPNALGRAQDRGDAHTCPLVRPCTACTRDPGDRTYATAIDAHRDCPPGAHVVRRQVTPARPSVAGPWEDA